MRPREAPDVQMHANQLSVSLEAVRELPHPEPVAIGKPGAGYPLPWSVQTWIPGIVATDQDPGEPIRHPGCCWWSRHTGSTGSSLRCR